MPLPELTRRLVEQKLSAYCREAQLAHRGERISLSFSIVGNRVTLKQECSFSGGDAKPLRIAIAQFRFDPAGGHWTRHWAGGDGHWYEDEEFEPARDFDLLLRDFSEDPVAIVWD